MRVQDRSGELKFDISLHEEHVDLIQQFGAQCIEEVIAVDMLGGVVDMLGCVVTQLLLKRSLASAESKDRLRMSRLSKCLA